MNKKSTILLCLSLAGAAGASAQQYVVSGTVRDAKSKEPVEFASAALLRTDSTVVTGATTDEQGRFTIKAKEKGKYIVRISYVGFDSQYKNVELSAAQTSVNVGTLEMGTSDVTLGTAVVSVTAARVEQKADTTMYNASAYRVPEGSTLEALIKQLPGVEIDDDGTIKWNGKEVKEFLINGKDFFKGDTETAMKNLPTELVSKIKAYDKASDYTEQTGIDDGEETTVLDITTKKKFDESWVSNVDLAYGTKDRYSTRFFGTRFTDNSRVTAYASANNVGNRGFGGPRGFGGGGSGLIARKDAGMDFYWDNGRERREGRRLELGGNVRYSHNSTDAVSTTSSETFLSGGSSSSFSNSLSRSDNSSTNVNGAFRLMWNPDSMTTVMFRPSFSHSSSHNRGDSRTATFNDDPYAIGGIDNPLDSIFAATVNPSLYAIAVNTNRRLSLSDSKSNTVEGSLMAIRRLNSKGRNVSLHASGGYTKSESNSYSVSDIQYYNGDPANFLNQYSTTPSKNWNYRVRIGYTEPFAKNWYAEARYQFSYRYSDSDRSRFNLDSLGGDWSNMEWAMKHIGWTPTEDEILNTVRDLNNSQYATYKYYNHSANVGIRYIDKNIRFNAGVDFNPERTKLAYQRLGQNIDTLITRKVFNVSPQVRFRYKFNETTQLDIRYRGSSSQPSMTDLIAVIDDSDPLNVSMGNPGLKPSWSNNLRIFYNTYNSEKQQGMMAGFFMTQNKNSVSNRVIYDESTGVRYSRPENINGNWNASGNYMFNTGFGPDKTFTVATFTGINYSNAVGYISRFGDNGSGSTGSVVETGVLDTYDDYDRLFSSTSSSKNTTRTLGINEHLNLSYRTDMFDVGLIGRLRYQHARATLQENANMDTWNFAYGANANVNFDWGMSISTDIQMTSRRGYSDNSMNTNELVWNAQIAQSFLKNKAATLSLQFYDILHQQSNVSRVINATMRSDSWNNAINAYCMVHFIYRLNIFGGTSNGGNSGGPGGPGGRGPGMRPMHRF